MTEERKREIGEQLVRIANELTAYAVEYSKAVGEDVSIEISANFWEPHKDGEWRSYVRGNLHIGTPTERMVCADGIVEIGQMLTTDRNDMRRRDRNE